MKLTTVLFLLLAVSLVRPQTAAADYIWHVNLGLTPPGTWYLGFDLFGGSPSLSSTVTISSFNTTATLGPSSQSGNVTGTLTQLPLVLTGSSPFNEYLQQITSKGTTGASTDTVSFDFVLSTNFGTQAQPDVFDVFMLNSNLVRYSTGDPTGANAFVRGYSAANAETFGTPWGNTLTVTYVPEPATFLLGVVGLGWLIFRHSQRPGKCSSNVH